MISLAFLTVCLFSRLVHGGTTIWSGNFDSYSTVADFDNWSWSDEVGEYQWYIHGSQPTADYLALGPDFKNPADTSETQGLKLTIDSSAIWNSDGMERTELIPQTSQNLGTGELFYHFSLMHEATNPPTSSYEHQIFFFESHFTELKYGVSPNTSELQWEIGGVPQWSTPFIAGTWYNFAYDINFSGGTVALYASTNGDPLVQVMPATAASPSTNSEDWHVGVLCLSTDTAQEDYYISGVYIESGPITTAIGNGSAPAPPPSSSSSGPTAAPTTSAPTSVAPPTSTSTAAGPLQTQWGQCGGAYLVHNASIEN
ncbi:carbohydrate-binding module family 1 protein [Obba rivulosa]|uniref:Carbohydrate-binding module family 1 protein n=1 Tax=Obba rivulosa TaxID=1052685 RepID=A0A8E2DNI0_9APHY|nr:carbohydrate-binding module family 1 protein [Obba rivulosa]